jgi:hypothetical protein
MNQERKNAATRRAIYALIAVFAFFACWYQNLHYLPHGYLGAWGAFIKDLGANPAAKSISLDIAFLSLAVFIWMGAEAKKHNIKHLWAYIVFGLIIGVSFTIPLFLMKRETILATKLPHN